MQYNAPQALNTSAQWEQAPHQRTKTRTRGKNRSRNSQYRNQVGSPRRQSDQHNTEELRSAHRQPQQPAGSNPYQSISQKATSQASAEQTQQPPTYATPSVRRHGRGPRSSGYRTSSSRRHQKEYQAASNASSQQLPQIGGNTMKRPPTTGNGRELVITSETHSTAAVSSIKGLKPNNPNWTNQDNFFVSENSESDMLMYCVLDGHGEVGHLVSIRCRQLFPDIIRQNNYDMKKAFFQMQNDLISCEVDSRCSGATCNLAVISNNVISVSNCGDSRCVLGRRGVGGGYTALQLSHDHKPDNPDERKRVLSCGGHLGCRQAMVNQGGRGLVSVPVGPCRVWYQYRGDTLGLAMSRSLGDGIVHKCGVSAEPETIDHTIVEGDEFLILATDGIWDVVDSNQAVQVVQNFAIKSPNWDAHEAALWLSKYARSRWEKMSPMVDDITCIIVKLNATANPPSHGHSSTGGGNATLSKKASKLRNN